MLFKYLYTLGRCYVYFGHGGWTTRDAINFDDFGIRNGINSQNSGIHVCDSGKGMNQWPTFEKLVQEWKITFTNDGYKVGYTFLKNWYIETDRF